MESIDESTDDLTTAMESSDESFDDLTTSMESIDELINGSITVMEIIASLNNGSSTAAENIAKSEDESERLEKDEVFSENGSLKNVLSHTLEFKRFLDEVYENLELRKLRVVKKLQQHYTRNFYNFEDTRKLFTESLIKTIPNFNSKQLTKCSNRKCKLPGCKRKMHNAYKMCRHMHSKDEVLKPYRIVPRGFYKYRMAAPQICNCSNDNVAEVPAAAEVPVPVPAPVATPVPSIPKRGRPPTKQPTTLNDAEGSKTAKLTIAEKKAYFLKRQAALRSKRAYKKRRNAIALLQKRAPPRKRVQRFYCKAKDCFGNFDHHRELLAHYKQHGKFYKCSHCTTYFQTKVNVYRHFIRIKPEEY